jgi:hypothetical protein
VAHNGRNVGPDRVKLIVFYASTRGQQTTHQARGRAPDIKAPLPLHPAATPLAPPGRQPCC